MNVQQAINKLEEAANESIVDGCFQEADDNLNDASRDLINAMIEEHGKVWLGSYNLYDNDRVAVWEHWGGLVCNFEAAFVLPVESQELSDLILERHDSEYTGSKDDWARLKVISKMVRDLGGKDLYWS